jgi:hypothetical protein
MRSGSARFAVDTPPPYTLFYPPIPSPTPPICTISLPLPNQPRLPMHFHPIPNRQRLPTHSHPIMSLPPLLLRPHPQLIFPLDPPLNNFFTNLLVSFPATNFFPHFRLVPIFPRPPRVMFRYLASAAAVSLWGQRVLLPLSLRLLCLLHSSRRLPALSLCCLTAAPTRDLHSRPRWLTCLRGSPLPSSSLGAPVLNLDEQGKPLTFCSALAGRFGDQWRRGNGDELLKLVETSRALTPVHHATSPPTYLNNIVKEKWSPAALLRPGHLRDITSDVDRRVRGTAGGDRLSVEIPVSPSKKAWSDTKLSLSTPRSTVSSTLWCLTMPFSGRSTSQTIS